MSIGRGALPRLDGTGRKLFWGVRPGRLDARTIDDRLYGLSAIGGKADMTVCGSPLSRSLLGVKRTWVGALHMSAFDPKRTLLFAPHMSALGGKADMTFCGCPLLRSLLGVKRTWRFALQMFAFNFFLHAKAAELSAVR